MCLSLILTTRSNILRNTIYFNNLNIINNDHSQVNKTKTPVTSKFPFVHFCPTHCANL